MYTCKLYKEYAKTLQATASQDGTLTYYEISLNTVHGLHKDRYQLLYVCSIRIITLVLIGMHTEIT